MTDQTNRAMDGSFDVVNGFRIAGIVTTLLILIQVALAGRGWFIDFDLIEVHGIVGNVTLIAGLGMAALAIAGYRRNLLDRLDVAVSVLIVILTVAQIGLGYGGRESSTAASLHWPNGVLLTILTATLLGRTLPRRDATGR